MSKNETVYTTEALLKSERFSYVQQDFLKAILKKDKYTITEAEKEINKVLGGAK